MFGGAGMNLLGIWELERKQIDDYVNLALEVKKNPQLSMLLK